MKKLKNDMKPKFHYDNCWRANFWFCLGWNQDAFAFYIKKQFDHEISTKPVNGKTIEFFDKGNHICVVWTRKKRDIPSLVHECLHAAIFTLDMRGVKFDVDNHEPLTYLVESLVRKALEKP